MLKDLIIANRSVRGYDTSVKVSTCELRDMIDCARLSASSVNKQCLRYYIACDDTSVEILRKETKLGGLLPKLGLPFEGTEPPAYICICHDKDVAPETAAFAKDVGIAAQSITLRATEMGYNACMIGNYNPDKVKEALKLADNLSVKLVIAIGKSIENIKLVEVEEGESLAYYRDEDGAHIVPKMKLDDVIVNK